jgi:hypothetical protein
MGESLMSTEDAKKADVDELLARANLGLPLLCSNKNPRCPLHRKS